MKIFYIDPQSYNNLADYDKYLLENIDEQKVFFCSQNMPYGKIDKTKIIRLYNYQSKKNIFKIISYLSSQTKLLRLIKREKPHIIHFQWFKIPIFDFLLLRIIKRKYKNTKIIHTAHNVLPHDSGAKYKNVYKKIYHFVDKIIVHAEVTRQEIITDFGIDENKIFVIPHGYLPARHRFDRTENKKKKITFSFIGFLSDYKGLDILLDAWCSNSELLNSDLCRLIIAGAGDLPCLKTIPSGKNIVLENYFHTEEDLSKIISETDVAILPYRKISQSGVLLTYLAEHIPVIVSNIGGLTQPFEIGNVGWILNELSSDSLANILLNVIKVSDQLQVIKNNNALWSRIDEFYDWKSIGQKTQKLYES